MTALTVQIEDRQADALRRKADRFGLGPEQFLKASVEDLIGQPDPEVDRAADGFWQRTRNCTEGWPNAVLSISEVLELHQRLIGSSGGSYGIRDLGTLASALNQPTTCLI